MALSKEDLLSKPVTVGTEKFHISVLGGDVTLQGIVDMNLYGQIEDANATARKLIEKGIVLPPYQGMTIEQICAARYILFGLAEPKLETEDEAFAFVRRIGPAAALMAMRIMALSGVSQESFAEKEAALEANPFPPDDDHAGG